MLNPDQMTAAMGAIRDQILALTKDHENSAHNGEACWGNRLGTVAFLAHSLGLGTLCRSAMLEEFHQILTEYDDDCETLDCPHRDFE